MGQVKVADLNMDTGVYRITNTVSDRVYIGSAIDMEKRIRSHRAYLERGEHSNKHLQRSWDKYGPGVFIFQPLVECSIETRKEREQRFIDAYIEHGLPIYNMRESAESREGFRYVPTEVTKQKMSTAWAARKLRGPVSDGTRKKLSVLHKGRKFSLEHCAKISKARMGIKLSDETKKKLSEINKGRRKSMEQCAAQSARLMGHQYSDETKAKISVGLRRYWATTREVQHEA